MGVYMISTIQKYGQVVRKSSTENENAIRLLYNNRLYKKVVGTLREELELYVRTLYLLNQSSINRERILADFFDNKQWTNERGKRITDRELLEFAGQIKGYGWEQISYKFACCFIHLSMLHNWDNEDVTTIIETHEKQIIISFINQYHCANLNNQSTFVDFMQYGLAIFEKIKGNMEYYLDELEKTNNCESSEK